jgi:hypothetical protein
MLLCILWVSGGGNIERNWYWRLMCFCEFLVYGNTERNWYYILVCWLWGSGEGQYREERTVYVFVLLWWSGGGQYGEELLLNVTVFVVCIWWRVIWRRTGTECHCALCEGLVEGNTERNWYWKIMCLLRASGIGQYREELVINGIVFFVILWWLAI